MLASRFTRRPATWCAFRVLFFGLAGIMVGLLSLPALLAEELSLANCLHETAEHSPAIIEQRSAIEQAMASRLTLRARALPSLTFGGTVGSLNQEQNVLRTRTVTVNGQSRTVVDGSVQTADNRFIALGTVALFQSLFDAAIPASYRRGTAEVLAAQQNFYSVASLHLHTARLLFYQALYQQRVGELLRQSDEILTANVKSQNDLVTAGLGGRAPLLSAQVQRANFGPGIVSTAGTYRTTLATLFQIMGRELPYAQDGADPLGKITLTGALDEAACEFDAAAVLRLALERRPDLRALRAMVKEEQEDTNIARAGYYPLIRLYLQGEGVPQNNVRNRPNAIRQSDQVQTTELRPGITGNWVVIDPGNTRGAVQAQEAARDTLAISLRRLETDLPAGLATVRARLTDATSRLDALRGNVDAAQNTLNIIKGGVAQGINTQTEFLNAQTELLNVQIGLFAARLEMSLAHAEFDRLTGNYLRFVDDEPARPAARHPAKK